MGLRFDNGDGISFNDGNGICLGYLFFFPIIRIAALQTDKNNDEYD